MVEARLQVTDAHGRRVVPLDKVLFSIGRRSASDLQVFSTDVSREHAEIACVDGQFVVRDRGSRFGTYVNDEAITERAIAHGDRIRLGRTDAAELMLLELVCNGVTVGRRVASHEARPWWEAPLSRAGRYGAKASAAARP